MKNKAYANLLMFLTRFNISPNKIMKVYKVHGIDTLNIIQNKPYSLSDRVRGFGFATCDRIALSMEKFTIHNIERIKHGIIYCMEKALNEEGHCYIEREELVARAIEELSLSLPLNVCSQYLKNGKDGEKVFIKIYDKVYSKDYNDLKVEYERVKAIREYRKNDEKIYIDTIKMDELLYALSMLIENKILVVVNDSNKELIYLSYVQKIEVHCAKLLSNYLTIENKKVLDINLDHLISAYEETKGIKLETRQIDGIKMMLDNNFGILAGSAGSGKTFSLNALIDIFDFVYKEAGTKLLVSLCAPTGKAAKRMSESTNMEAKTIHRLLGYRGDSFEYNENNKLPANVVIVDETSMLDIFLFHELLKALDPLKTKLLLVGDHKQLPPVGPGSPFVDLLNNKFVPKTILNVIKRQADGSGIIKNANRIIDKEMIESDNANKDFFIIPVEEKEEAVDKMIQCTKRLVEKNYTLDDIEIICPQKRGVIGTKEMNARLQEIFNPSSNNKPTLKFGDTLFRVGDKVIHTSNNYNMQHYKVNISNYLEPIDGQGIFNGEIGAIIDIIEEQTENESKKKNIIVKYDDIYTIYEHEDLDALELAYALTVHKVQGSQFKAVITCFHYTNFMMLNNNLGYTAITRAQEFVAVVGQVKAIKHMIRNVVTFRRNTNLNNYICDLVFAYFNK